MAVIYLVAWEDSEVRRAQPAQRDAVAGVIEKKYDTRQEPGLDNVRFVFTGDTGASILEHVQQHLGETVRVLVSRVELAGLEGFLSKATWRWIDSRIGRLVSVTEI